MALINRRCHEWKVRLADLRRARASGEQQQRLDRLSEAVEIYDSSLTTGHDVLDRILAEQSLYCREQGIAVHCVADGAQLQFMKEADLYTLCTGMLQQAFGQARDLPDSGQRELDLQVYHRQGVVMLEPAISPAHLPQGGYRWAGRILFAKANKTWYFYLPGSPAGAMPVYGKSGSAGHRRRGCLPPKKETEAK